MSDPIFFRPALRATLSDIVAWTGAFPPAGARLDAPVENLASLDEAGPASLTFFDHPKELAALRTTSALACLLPPRLAKRLPAATMALATDRPQRDFALVLARLYPGAVQTGTLFGSNGISPGAAVHPDARIESEVIVDPGAVIGPKAEIGAGSIVGANAVIGPNVKIGRGSSIGPGAHIANALIGNRVTVHAGAAIGGDGFGFVAGTANHVKVPQIGRVIVQDDVEIGANAAIDRGAMRDTVIGEGTKIGNLVEIAHDVRIGRHCIIAAQAAISMSSHLGDFVCIGGQAGFAGHLEIGAGARIAGQAGVVRDVAENARLAGTPARAFRAWLNGQTMLDKMAGTRRGREKAR